MARIFVDTNVLFPFSLMDLMLALSEDGIHEVLWTERLLAEWERVIVREQQRTPTAARSITEAIAARVSVLVTWNLQDFPADRWPSTVSGSSTRTPTFASCWTPSPSK